ncbi:glycosyltransferase family 2 protein [Mangrovimonas sp. YM274]|uniref:glycosyltransferase family 2 protein n=1 Tax=Mangrovimonas sp. YM274 TaxID=3070660 RepID=UPI0027DD4B7E|nr:glycosyltransferase family 2 protein [Mangrovimonas sp. YM274]WMI70353.1 glycosyltransferase family 2 protein [Mangrovimonas sp. YM274]
MRETLDSILVQSYANWECLIIDDGSTDNTSEIVKTYIEKDNRFRYFRRTVPYKKGPSGCRNFGLFKSEGEFINWFDSDDLMQPSKLEKDLKALMKGNYDFTISQTLFFNNDTKREMEFWNECLYSQDPVNDFILKKIGWSTNAPLWKRKSLENVELNFNEDLIGPDDYDYHIKALLKKLKPAIIDEVLVKNRVHPNRIEYDNGKSYSRSIIVSELLENKDEFELSDECVLCQYKLSFYLVKNMYRNKKLREAMAFSKKLFSLNKHIFTKTKIIKLYSIGLFYKITNRGYSWFDKVKYNN